jgi:hypothetical protein
MDAIMLKNLRNRIARRFGKRGNEMEEETGTQVETKEETGTHVVVESNHEHGPWKRGILPGQKYVKICKGRLDDGSECGLTLPVEMAEWQNYA